MPILVGTTTIPADPQVPPIVTPDPFNPPSPIDPGRPQAVWIAPDGTEVQLTSDRELHFTLNAVSGWGAAPVSLVADPHPRGGTRVRHIQPQARVITWPLMFKASTHMELVEGMREIAGKFTQTRRLGPGRLRVMRPDGSAREILAYYQEGFTGEAGQGHTYDTAVLNLYCEDPYWRAVSPVTLPYSNGAPVSYLSPYLTVSPSSVLGVTSATNPGDVEAWPSWSIVGPASAVTATNHTTGESFTLTATLTAGQTATITTDPPTVRGPAGQNWTGNLDWPGAALWGLQPGLNDVEFAVAGASSATSITLAYVPRYETA